MPFIFLFLFSFAWSEIGTCGEPCKGSSVLGGDVSNTGGLCFTLGAVSARYDNLVHACEVKGLYNGYCICIAATYCPGYYMIRGSCSDTSSVVVPPPEPSSSSSAPPPPPVSSSSPPPEYSSTSTDCPGNEFNPVNVLNGFRDYWDIFYLIFACFILVKLLNLIK